MLKNAKRIFKYFTKTPPVLLAGHPILRLSSRTLSHSDLYQEHFYKAIQDMRKVFDSPYTSVIGLSAPQLGHSLRIIGFQITDAELLKQRKLDPIPTTFIINPKLNILDSSEKWVAEYESCESIPNYNGLVKRSDSINVTGWDLNGKEVDLNAQGILARIIQHEVDHLDGHLFTDKILETSLRHDNYIDEYDQYIQK